MKITLNIKPTVARDAMVVVALSTSAEEAEWLKSQPNLDMELTEEDFSVPKDEARKAMVGFALLAMLKRLKQRENEQQPEQDEQ